LPAISNQPSYYPLLPSPNTQRKEVPSYQQIAGVASLIMGAEEHPVQMRTKIGEDTNKAERLVALPNGIFHKRSMLTERERCIRMEEMKRMKRYCML
jgi:hypothetical protein